MIKKSLIFKFIVTINVILIILGCSISNADMGSKPSFTIHLKNLKPMKYDIGLLVYHDPESNDAINYYKSYLDKPTKLQKAILDYYDNGYYSNYYRDTTLWRDDEENDTYTFKYFGLPKAFKVIIAYDDGSVYVSEYIDRSQYRGEIDLDASTMNISIKTRQSFINFILVPLLLTVVVELLISTFDFIKKNIHNCIVIILTNIITNVSLQFLQFAGFMGYATLSISFILKFLLVECIITQVEMLIYMIFIKDTDKDKIMRYSLAANFVTMLMTFFIPYI